jgi:molecular chaperone GrpE
MTDPHRRPSEDPAEQPAPEQTTPAAETAEEQAAPPDPAVLEAEVAVLKDKLLRALADVENMRRRNERDVTEARAYAITGFAREMLEIADNFGRAVASIPEEARREGGLLQNLAEGVEQTERQLHGVFDRHRIARVEPQLGERFDHTRHQAMFEVETPDLLPGTVAQVMVPGYTIGDRLLRPAMVGVAKAPQPRVVDQPDGSGGVR